MILRYPEYYERFSCIAGRCEDTCCAGWEIDIDDESYQAYMQVEGEFGDRLRMGIKEYTSEKGDAYERHGFKLKEGKRCFFLREDGLCDMILALGENALCDVCADTPRNFLEYGGAREISISPSCAEAGRLIFWEREPVRFLERETAEELEFGESEEELRIAALVRAVRDKSIVILQERKWSIEHRLVMFLRYARDVQEYFNCSFSEGSIGGCFQEEDIQGLYQEKGLREFCLECERAGRRAEEAHFYFRKRLELYGGMAGINEEWQGYIDRMGMLFADTQEGRERYRRALERFKRYLKEAGRDYEYEQFLVYNAFLFLARCVDDFNFWGKAQFVAVTFLLLRDMDVTLFTRHHGEYLPEDRVDVARIYAKEVEHSEDNLAYLEEEFLFGEIYGLEELCRQVFSV